MSLHPPTMLFAMSLTAACCGGLLFLARGSTTEALALRIWGLSMILVATGLATVMAGGLRDLFTVGLGNAMLLAARSIAWSGARRFNGKPERLGLAMVGPLLWLMTVPMQSSRRWIAVACLVCAVYTAATVVEMARDGMRGLPSRGPLLLVLTVHALLYVGRGVAIAYGMNEGPQAELLVRLVLAEGMIHIVTVSVLLLSMTRERVEALAVQEMRALALQDALTGVGNRRHFDEQLALESRRAERAGSSLGLLLIDVDHFKAFNDAFGHPRGDWCLRAVADAIGRCVRRPGDLVARYGGEEFVVLLPNTGRAGAVEVAEAIRAAVRALAIATPAGCGQVTISVGVAAVTAGSGPSHPDDLLAEADAALYTAKSSGRDVVRSRWHAEVAETVGGG